MKAFMMLVFLPLLTGLFKFRFLGQNLHFATVAKIVCFKVFSQSIICKTLKGASHIVKFLTRGCAKNIEINFTIIYASALYHGLYIKDGRSHWIRKVKPKDAKGITKLWI